MSAELAASDAPEETISGFQSFDKVATDVVLATSFNSTGTRFATASADHRLRIYNVVDEDQTTVVDQWRAHDAEVTGVQWLPAAFGQCLGTISSDNKFKLWREDPSQPHNSGRRFRCIFSQSPFSGMPYSSFELHAKGSDGAIDVYLALLAQDGLLSLLEPSEPDSLSAWRELDQLYPFGKFSRSQGASLDLSFHQGVAPSSEALMAGLDVNVISLAVSSACAIKILQAIKPTEDSGYQFQEILEIEIPDGPSENSLPCTVNSVAWAPGAMRPHYVVAAACEDSTLRVFDIHVSESSQQAHSNTGLLSRYSKHQSAGSRALNSQRRPSGVSSKAGPSGIGAGLAEMTKSANADRTAGFITIGYEWKQSAVLRHERNVAVRKVIWAYDGSLLASTADDGIIRLWRQGSDGKYFEYSESGAS